MCPARCISCFPLLAVADGKQRQRLLQEAAKLVGKEELAKALNVPVTLLDIWLRGLATMPERKVLPLADLLLEKLERREKPK